MLIFYCVHIAHTSLQRVYPIRYLCAESFFYLCFVEYGISWTSYRTWKFITVAGLYIAVPVACQISYFFSKVIPAAYTFVAEVVDTCITCEFSVFYNVEYHVG